MRVCFILYFVRPQPELNLDCWVTERLTVKGREREQGVKRERWRRKSSAGGGHRCGFSPRSLFSWHTTARLPQRPCFPSEYSPFSSPSLNDKRGEQAWAGIIGSFLSAPAMCEDSNNGRDREEKWFKVWFSPAPFSRGSPPFTAC